MDVSFWLENNLLASAMIWQVLWFMMGFLAGCMIWYPIVKVVVCGR